MKIYAPEGLVAAPETALADATHELANKRIGILDNTKPNAGILLGRIADRVADRTGATVAVVEQKNAALAAPDEVMGRLIAEVDLVLTGSAD